MINTTLIYINKDNKILFLNRNKKKNDMNKDKYIGIGGHQIKGETIENCLKREVKEETGLNLKFYEFRGLIHFVNTVYESEDIYLYTGILEDGNLIECNEGTFVWVKKEDINKLPLWEGDKYFLKVLFKQNIHNTFELSLNYDREKLISVYGPFYSD